MENIRNFAIIAHVDHGKSTLADRMLELTGTVSSRQMRDQLLDSNPIERERGITIKLAPVRMVYKIPNSKLKTLNNLEFRHSKLEIADSEYILNLIDTPGHVDFSYEVNRSLAACEGAILLIDATQGVQAQTLAHFRQAQKLGLVVIPVINKIDIQTADIPGTKNQISEILNLDSDTILLISAKTGQGVPELLQAVISRIPAPRSLGEVGTRALVFNSNFDPHLGVIAWVRIVEGQIKKHDKLILLGTSAPTSVLELGVFTPHRQSTASLSAGEVGYIVTSLKDLSLLTIGDTISLNSSDPLPGYQPIKPMVYVSFYPTDGSEISALRESLAKLRLQDSSLSVTPEFSVALGNGFRIGFLGLLHADIVQERLEREFGLNVIAVAPSVNYEVVTANHGTLLISKAQDLPDPSSIREIREPMLESLIIVPERYVGAVLQLGYKHRGTLLKMTNFGSLIQLTYRLPLAELIHNFYSSLKSVSQGFATMDYEPSGFTASDLVRLDILIAGEKIEALSQIVPKIQAGHVAQSVVNQLKIIIPRQQFEIAVQAAVGGKVLARADIKAFRKDVTAKLYGGDQTRKDKLLKKQKKGKLRMRRIGRVDIPQEAFLSILKID